MAPSTSSAVPLTYDACCEHRNATTRPKSAGLPMRPLTALPSERTRSVSYKPGQMVLRVMPSSNNSFAAVFAHAHSPVRAMFDRDSVGIGCLIDDDVIRQI